MGVVKEGPGRQRIRYRPVAVRELEPGQVRAQVLCAGICASDLAVASDRIRLTVRPPVVLGHEFVGRVVELGSGVTGWTEGATVVSETAFRVCGTCRMCLTGHDNVCPGKELIGYAHDGAFAQTVVLEASRLHRAPAGVALEALVLTEPLACCAHALLEQATIRPGDFVVVFGPGTIGLLSLQVARAAGATTVLCGRSSARLELGRQLGADHVVDVSDDEPAPLVAELSGGDGCDVFVECSGSETGLRTGLEVVRRRGQLIQQGFSGVPVMVPLDEVAYKELRVAGALGQKWSSWELALTLLSSGRVRTAELVTDRLPLSDWSEGFDLVERRAGGKVLLLPYGDVASEVAR